MKLNPGDKVGVISPSSLLDSPQMIELGLDYLRSLGFNPVLGKHVFDAYRYMAGTAKDRADDLHRFYADPEIKAIFCTRGGGGSQHILPLIDYDIIRSNPKPLFGFSDNTALQLALLAKADQITGSGFLLKYDFKNGHIDGLVESSLQTLLSGQKLVASGGETVIGGQAEGRLIGGSLSVMRNLCGTDYYPDLTDAILLLEDIGEKTYKIDLMLRQIAQCKGFDKIKGIVFGEFTAMQVADPEDGDMDEVVTLFCKDFKIPVIKNFPYGHVPSRFVLPIGAKVRLNANRCQLEVI